MKRTQLKCMLVLMACGANSATQGTDAGIDGGSNVPTAFKVLFIGNSYVQVNDLPLVLRRIVETADAGDSFDSEVIAVGGATLEDHWNTGLAQARISAGHFTHVVLQGQSVEPLLSPASFNDFAQRFGDLTVDAGATPVFYGTWARAPGDLVYGEVWSGGTASVMQDRLTAAYASVASRWPSANLARVGEAFRLITAQPTPPVLLQSDGSHPTIAGTYLAACVFWVTLTRQPVPTASEVPTGVLVDEAVRLRAAATSVTP